MPPKYICLDGSDDAYDQTKEIIVGTDRQKHLEEGFEANPTAKKGVVSAQRRIKVSQAPAQPVSSPQLYKVGPKPLVAREGFDINSTKFPVAVPADMEVTVLETQWLPDGTLRANIALVSPFKPLGWVSWKTSNGVIGLIDLDGTAPLLPGAPPHCSATLPTEPSTQESSPDVVKSPRASPRSPSNLRKSQDKNQDKGAAGSLKASSSSTASKAKAPTPRGGTSTPRSARRASNPMANPLGGGSSSSSGLSKKVRRKNEGASKAEAATSLVKDVETEAKEEAEQAESGSSKAAEQVKAVSADNFAKRPDTVPPAEPAPLGASKLERSITTSFKVSTLKAADVFKEWDIDGDGQITKKEFARSLSALGVTGTRAEHDAVFARWDVNRSGSLDVKELSRALRAGSAGAARSESAVAVAFESRRLRVVDVFTVRASLRPPHAHPSRVMRDALLS